MPGMASAAGSAALPVMTARIPERVMPAMAARLEQSLPAGNEGAGVVIATGSSDAARQRQYDAVLKRRTLEEMWTPIVPVSPGVSMGLTYFLERHSGLDFIAHSGGQNGFISHFYVHPPSRFAYIVAFNTQTTSAKAGEKRNTRALDAALRDVMVKTVFR